MSGPLPDWLLAAMSRPVAGGGHPWDSPNRRNVSLIPTVAKFDIEASGSTILAPHGEEITVYNIVDIDQDQTRWTLATGDTTQTAGEALIFSAWVWASFSGNIVLRAQQTNESNTYFSVSPGWNLIEQTRVADSSRSNSDFAFYQWHFTPSYGEQIAIGPMWVLPA